MVERGSPSGGTITCAGFQMRILTEVTVRSEHADERILTTTKSTDGSTGDNGNISYKNSSRSSGITSSNSVNISSSSSSSISSSSTTRTRETQNPVSRIQFPKSDVHPTGACKTEQVQTSYKKNKICEPITNTTQSFNKTQMTNKIRNLSPVTSQKKILSTSTSSTSFTSSNSSIMISLPNAESKSVPLINKYSLIKNSNALENRNAF